MPSIYLRGETYWARVQHKGKEIRRSLETTSRSVAQERLNEFVADVSTGKWKSAKGHAYEVARDKFVREHCKRLKPRSAKRYVTSLVALDRFFSGHPIEDISGAMLSSFEAARRQEGVEPGTIRRDLSCLSSMMTCAQIDWEWITDNPVAAYMRKATKRRTLVEAPPRTRYLSHEEERVLLAAIEAAPLKTKNTRHQHAYQQLYRAVVLAIETGLRAEEQFGLVWPDIDIDTNRLTVRRERAKSGKQRLIPLSDRALDVLQSFPRKGVFVITKKTGDRYKGMLQPLQKFAKQVGIEDLEWHDLRKTYGCRMLQDRQMPLEHVSTLLGHSTVEQTRRAYAFLEVRHIEQRLQSAPKRLTRGE